MSHRPPPSALHIGLVPPSPLRIAIALVSASFRPGRFVPSFSYFSPIWLLFLNFVYICSAVRVVRLVFTNV